MNETMPVLRYSMNGDKLLIPLLVLGKMYHHKYGEIEYTEKDFLDIKNNLVSQKLGFSPYVTHGHINTDSYTDDMYIEQARLQALSTDAELKRGEITDVVMIDDVVYAIAENLHPNTKALVESKEYEYASGEFLKNFIDKETGSNIGTVLVRTSLTNAPAMPFKDKKLQLFSENGEESLQTLDSFVVKLQEDTELNSFISMTTENELEVTTEELESTVEADKELKTDEESLEQAVLEVEKEETKAKEDETVSSEVEETKEEEVTPAVNTHLESVKVPDSPAAVEQEDSDLDPQQVVNLESANETISNNKEEEVNLIMDATKQVAEQFSAQIESLKSIYEEKFAALEETSSAVINNLKETVNELQTKLVQQESVAQQFSATLNNTAKQNRYNRLAKEGVAPAVIEKFSLFETALEGASIQSKVLKFSTTEGDAEEKNLLQALEDLVVEASKSNVSVQKFGQNSVEGDDLVSELKSIINRNRQLKK